MPKLDAQAVIYGQILGAQGPNFHSKYPTRFYHPDCIIIIPVKFIYPSIPQYSIQHLGFMILSLICSIIPEYSIQRSIFKLALFTIYLRR